MPLPLIFVHATHLSWAPVTPLPADLAHMTHLTWDPVTLLFVVPPCSFGPRDTADSGSCYATPCNICPRDTSTLAPLTPLPVPLAHVTRLTWDPVTLLFVVPPCSFVPRDTSDSGSCYATPCNICPRDTSDLGSCYGTPCNIAHVTHLTWAPVTPLPADLAHAMHYSTTLCSTCKADCLRFKIWPTRCITQQRSVAHAKQTVYDLKLGPCDALLTSALLHMQSRLFTMRNLAHAMHY
jgi:hypothetical protein